MISASDYSAFQLVFGPNPAYLSGWRNQDEDLLFAQDALASGLFVQQWKLRAQAQGHASKEVANSDLRAPSA